MASGLARLPYLQDTEHVGARAKGRTRVRKRDPPAACDRAHGVGGSRHERAKGLAHVSLGSRARFHTHLCRVTRLM